MAKATRPLRRRLNQTLDDDLPDGTTHPGLGHVAGEVALIEQTGRQATETWQTDCHLMRLAEPGLEADITWIVAFRRAQSTQAD